MASGMDVLPRTVRSRIDQEDISSESDDSLTSTDDSRDSPDEVRHSTSSSTSQLKITGDTFQSGYKRRTGVLRVDGFQQRRSSVDGGYKEPRLSNPGTLVRPTSAKKQRKTSTTSRKSPSGDDSEYTPQRNKKTSRKQLIEHEKTVCSIFDFDKPDDASQQNPVENPILSALQDISSTLSNLVNRVENTEKDIKIVKKKLGSSSPSSSSDSSKTFIPNVIRSETRKMYKTLLDEDDDFPGFQVGPTIHFDDAVNQRVVNTLIKEVQATNPSFQACQIRGAAKTYYKTLSQEESLERRGKATSRKKIRRQKERLLRKLNERKSIFQKKSYEENNREKWAKVLCCEMMSSEESGEEAEGQKDCIVVKILPWRSTKVNSFMESLDEALRNEKSKQSIRQTKRRILDPEPSSRPKPVGKFPTWAFV